MAQDHHVHTKSDPQNLKDAEEIYAKFMVGSRNSVIAIVILLSLMAFFLV